MCSSSSSYFCFVKSMVVNAAIDLGYDFGGFDLQEALWRGAGRRRQ